MRRRANYRGQTGGLENLFFPDAIFSLVKMNPQYNGPCCRCINEVTQVEADINFDSNGEVDEAAVLALGNGTDTVQIITLYNQVGTGNNADAPNNAFAHALSVNGSAIQRQGPENLPCSITDGFGLSYTARGFRYIRTSSTGDGPFTVAAIGRTTSNQPNGFFGMQGNNGTGLVDRNVSGLNTQFSGQFADYTQNGRRVNTYRWNIVSFNNNFESYIKISDESPYTDDSGSNVVNATQTGVWSYDNGTSIYRGLCTSWVFWDRHIPAEESFLLWHNLNLVVAEIGTGLRNDFAYYPLTNNGDEFISPNISTTNGYGWRKYDAPDGFIQTDGILSAPNTGCLINSPTGNIQTIGGDGGGNVPYRTNIGLLDSIGERRDLPTTLLIWFKPDDLLSVETDSRGIWTKGVGTGNGLIFQLFVRYIDPDYYFAAFLYSNSGINRLVAQVRVLDTNFVEQDWNQLAVTYSGNGINDDAALKIYTNGIFGASSVLEGGFTGTSGGGNSWNAAGNNRRSYIGRLSTSPADINKLAGRFCELYTLTREATSAEILSWYNTNLNGDRLPFITEPYTL